MKRYNWIITLVSAVGVVAGIFMVCQPDSQNVCRGVFREFSSYIQSGFASIFLISLPLYFVRENVFRTWGKFALWFVPLSAVLVFSAPDYSHDFIAPFDKKLTSMWVVGIFLLLSLLIIAVKSWKLRKRKK